MTRDAAVVLAVVLMGSAVAGAGEPAPHVSSSFVTAPDGARIHVLQAGDASTPAMLFVPGWTMGATIWQRQIQAFAPSHHVVAMDPRGQGDSSKEHEGLYPDARARDIRAVVETLNLEPVVLVGWSMGVPEVLAYVSQFGTASVRALVLVDGIAGGDFDPLFTPAMIRWVGSLQRDRRAVTESFVRSMFRKPQSEEYLRGILEMSLKTPTDAAVALFVGTMASDYRPVLPKLDRPTLLVVSPNPFAPRYEEMATQIPGCRKEVFEDAGHALFVDDADRFNALLTAFLASAPPSP